MKKHISFLLVVFLLILPSQADTSSYNVGGTGVEHLTSLDVLEKGIYVTAGWTNSSDISQSVGQYAGKVDGFFSVIQKGALLRQVYVGGSGYDILNAVAAESTTSETIYVAGYTNSTDLNGTYSGNGDAMIGAYDANGTMQWLNYLGGNEMDTATGVAIGTEMVYFAGTTRSNFNGSDGEDVFVSAYAANGSWAWTTQIVEPGDERTTFFDIYNGVVVLESVSDFNETILYNINTTGQIVNTTRHDDFVSLDSAQILDQQVSLGHNTTSGKPVALRHSLGNFNENSITDLTPFGNYSDVVLTSYLNGGIVVAKLENRYEFLEFDNQFTNATNITDIDLTEISAITTDAEDIIVAGSMNGDGVLVIKSPINTTPSDDVFVTSEATETFVSSGGFGFISFFFTFIIGIGILVVLVNVVISMFRKSSDDELDGGYIPIDSSGPLASKATSKTPPLEIPVERTSICRTCGEQLGDEDVFCSNCGTSL